MQASAAGNAVLVLIRTVWASTASAPAIQVKLLGTEICEFGSVIVLMV